MGRSNPDGYFAKTAWTDLENDLTVYAAFLAGFQVRDCGKEGLLEAAGLPGLRLRFLEPLTPGETPKSRRARVSEDGRAAMRSKLQAKIREEIQRRIAPDVAQIDGTSLAELLPQALTRAVEITVEREEQRRSKGEGVGGASQPNAFLDKLKNALVEQVVLTSSKRAVAFKKSNKSVSATTKAAAEAMLQALLEVARVVCKAQFKRIVKTIRQAGESKKYFNRKRQQVTRPMAHKDAEASGRRRKKSSSDESVDSYNGILAGLPGFERERTPKAPDGSEASGETNEETETVDLVAGLRVDRRWVESTDLLREVREAGEAASACALKEFNRQVRWLDYVGGHALDAMLQRLALAGSYWAWRELHKKFGLVDDHGKLRTDARIQRLRRIAARNRESGLDVGVCAEAIDNAIFSQSFDPRQALFDGYVWTCIENAALARRPGQLGGTIPQDSKYWNSLKQDLEVSPFPNGAACVPPQGFRDRWVRTRDTSATDREAAKLALERKWKQGFTKDGKKRAKFTSEDDVLRYVSTVLEPARNGASPASLDEVLTPASADPSAVNEDEVPSGEFESDAETVSARRTGPGDDVDQRVRTISDPELKCLALLRMDNPTPSVPVQVSRVNTGREGTARLIQAALAAELRRSPSPNELAYVLQKLHGRRLTLSEEAAAESSRDTRAERDARPVRRRASKKTAAKYVKPTRIPLSPGAVDSYLKLARLCYHAAYRWHSRARSKLQQRVIRRKQELDLENQAMLEAEYKVQLDALQALLEKLDPPRSAYPDEVAAVKYSVVRRLEFAAITESEKEALESKIEDDARQEWSAWIQKQCEQFWKGDLRLPSFERANENQCTTKWCRFEDKHLYGQRQTREGMRRGTTVGTGA